LSSKPPIRLSNEQLTLEVQVLGLMQAIHPSLLQHLPKAITKSIDEVGKLEEDFMANAAKVLESAKNLIEEGRTEDEGSAVSMPVMIASMKLIEMFAISGESRALDTLQAIHILENLSNLTNVPFPIVVGYDLKNNSDVEIETVSLSVPKTIYHRHNRCYYLSLEIYHVILAFIKMGSISESKLEILPPLQKPSHGEEVTPNPMHG